MFRFVVILNNHPRSSTRFNGVKKGTKINASHIWVNLSDETEVENIYLTLNFIKYKLI